jgi:hypothetical protein
MAEGGPVSQTGFVIMALLWWFTGWQGYLSARRGRFAQHRIWLIRNFAIAFGAVVLRLYLAAANSLGLDFYAVYPTAVWVCWTPCLVVAEIAISRKTANQRN